MEGVVKYPEAESKWLICSDVHGCLTDLMACLLNYHATSELYFLGDVLELGRTHEEDRCVTQLRIHDAKAVMGSHEAVLFENEDTYREVGFRFLTDISRKNTEYLRRLPSHIRSPGYLFTHSLPPGTHRRTRNIDEARQAFSYFTTVPDAQVIFAGHDHQTCAFWHDARSGQFGIERRHNFTLDEDKRYIIYPGSLKDNWTYMIFDPSARRISRRHLGRFRKLLRSLSGRSRSKSERG